MNQPLTEQQIRQIVRQEIQRDSAFSRFQLTPTNQHTHDGIDSPPVFQPVVNFIGLIQGGTVDANVAKVVLPKGWTLAITSSSPYTYTITHNLTSTGSGTITGNAIYAVSVQIDQDDAMGIYFAAPLVLEYANYFTVNMRTTGGVSAAASFTFILTLANNRSISFPSYSGSLVP